MPYDILNLRISALAVIGQNVRPKRVRCRASLGICPSGSNRNVERRAPFVLCSVLVSWLSPEGRVGFGLLGGKADVVSQVEKGSSHSETGAKVERAETSENAVNALSWSVPRFRLRLATRLSSPNVRRRDRSRGHCEPVRIITSDGGLMRLHRVG